MKDITSEKKVLLFLMPFWTPLIPPQGMLRIQKKLESNGYACKAVDVNIHPPVKDLYERYFFVLKENVPSEKQGNIYNFGHDVWRNHMVAHLNVKDPGEYLELVKEIVYQTFFTRFDDALILTLKEIVTNFYAVIETFCLDHLKDFNPTHVGFSMFIDNIGCSVFGIDLVKQYNRDISIVLGGPAFAFPLSPRSPDFQNFLKQTENKVDKIIIGPGDDLFLQYLQGLQPEEKFIVNKQDLVNVKPNINKVNILNLNSRAYPYNATFTSTSCPYKCSFCNVYTFWGEHSKREIDVSIDEMHQIYQRDKHQLFFLLDSLINTQIDDFTQAMYEAKSPLYWDAYFRVVKDFLDLETAVSWRKGGFYRARLGIETGSQRLLNIMDKQITIEETKATLINLAQAGIKTCGYFVVGHPGETEEDFQQTLDLLTELKEYFWQAEPNAFYYIYDGQSNNDDWARKRRFVYPEKFFDSLIYRTWTLDLEPKREEIYSRAGRFVEHCKKIGIPNPYSLKEINEADDRWKSLHKNAVPSLMDLQNNKVGFEEKLDVQVFSKAAAIVDDSGDFDF